MVVYGNSALSIQNCYNRGNISSYMGNAGGIIGNAGYAAGNKVVYIQNCYNTGNIETEKSGAIGSVIGRANGVNLINCHNSTSMSFRGENLSGTNTDCLKNWQTNLMWETSRLGSGYKNDDKNINGGYPILTWQ